MPHLSEKERQLSTGMGLITQANKEMTLGPDIIYRSVPGYHCVKAKCTLLVPTIDTIMLSTVV